MGTDCVQLLHYKCNKTNPNRGGSYLNSLDWKKIWKKTFQYAVTVALNHKQKGKKLQRISIIESFISK